MTAAISCVSACHRILPAGSNQATIASGPRYVNTCAHAMHTVLFSALQDVRFTSHAFFIKWLPLPRTGTRFADHAPIQTDCRGRSCGLLCRFCCAGNFLAGNPNHDGFQLHTCVHCYCPICGCARRHCAEVHHPPWPASQCCIGRYSMHRCV